MIEIVSLLSIMIAIIIGIAKNINVGFIALVFAFFLGTLLGGLSPNTIIGFWPLNLFFTTVGVTLFFSIAKINGTLENLSTTIIYRSHGSKIKIQIIFFVLAMGLSSIGPGNISAAALLLPIGLAIAYQSNMSLLMMSVLIIQGSIAGGLSPIAPNGIVVLELARLNNVGELGLSIYLLNMISIIIFSTLFFIAMKGYKMNGQKTEVSPPSPFTYEQKLTLLSILVLIIWVIFGKVHVGFAGFTLAVALFFFKAGKQQQAIQQVPWTTILQICGAAVLISVVGELGGIGMLTNFLASIMNEWTAVGIMSILSGAMATFASAVGVVMPTLIPTTVDLSESLSSTVSPGVLTMTIAVASHMTTMSPLSVMGALALGSMPAGVDEKKLFKKMYIVAFIALAFVSVFLGLLHQLGLIK
jgi:di/tricarboxylate transporter